MHCSFSASGSPAQVTQAITSQARSQRASAPESAAFLMATRDELLKPLAGADVNATVSISASISMHVTVSNPAPVAEPDVADDA